MGVLKKTWTVSPSILFCFLTKAVGGTDLAHGSQFAGPWCRETASNKTWNSGNSPSYLSSLVLGSEMSHESKVGVWKATLGSQNPVSLKESICSGVYSVISAT